MIFIFILSWPFAGIIGRYIYEKRNQYFNTGKLYYTLDRIKQIYTVRNPAEQKCYYCPARTADSKPYRIDLLKLKDIKVKSEGFRQHNANFINENASVLIPRSGKALIIHSICILFKFVSILSSLIFLDISSYVWRIIIGMISGGLISSLILILTRTKSNVSYLFCLNLVIRICAWIFFIALISQLSLSPFNITCSSYIHLIITLIVIFDSFLMQAINLLFGKRSLKPLIKQYEKTAQKFHEGFIVNNDVVVISFVYPLFKWIFG